mmetsp:Transcript_53342/g.126914  ORF Transcript_53342/g.126914 Transcript_53342/m.126914 type:complete len:407 (-) Transcript_53342:1272-2492(-)
MEKLAREVQPREVVARVALAVPVGDDIADSVREGDRILLADVVRDGRHGSREAAFDLVDLVTSLDQIPQRHYHRERRADGTRPQIIGSPFLGCRQHFLVFNDRACPAVLVDADDVDPGLDPFLVVCSHLGRRGAVDDHAVGVDVSHHRGRECIQVHRHAPRHLAVNSGPIHSHLVEHHLVLAPRRHHPEVEVEVVLHALLLLRESLDEVFGNDARRPEEPDRRGCPRQRERLVDGAEGARGILLVHHHCHLALGGALSNDADIDVGGGERAHEGGGHALAERHALSDDRYDRHPVHARHRVDVGARKLKFEGQLDCLSREVALVGRHSHTDRVLRRRLGDHEDVDAGRGHGRHEARRHAGNSDDRGTLQVHHRHLVNGGDALDGHDAVALRPAKSDAVLVPILHRR